MSDGFKLNIQANILNGYPILDCYLTGGQNDVTNYNHLLSLPIKPNIPFSPTVVGSNTYNILNGYPVPMSVNNAFTNDIKDYYNLLVLPIRPNIPLASTVLIKNSSILNGYPVPMHMDNTFINDAYVAKYPNNKFITPYSAKVLIRNYLLEKIQLQVIPRQVINPEIYPVTKGAKMKWTDPVEDENWQGTKVIARTDRFPTDLNEVGNIILASTNIRNSTGNQYKDEFYINKAQTNDIPLYCVFVTYNAAGDCSFNEENKFIITPKQEYEYIKNEYGDIIDVKPKE